KTRGEQTRVDASPERGWRVHVEGNESAVGGDDAHRRLTQPAPPTFDPFEIVRPILEPVRDQDGLLGERVAREHGPASLGQRDRERSPHTMHPDEDGSPRDSRSGVGFAGALLRRDGGQEAECLEGVTRVERTSGLKAQRRCRDAGGRNTPPPTYYWHENAGLW